MLRNTTAMKNLPHSLADNQQTPYDSFRLLKGSVTGQKQVSFYARELAIIRNNKLLTEAKYNDHLVDVASGQGFDYHYNVLDMGGITPDEKFYDARKIEDFKNSIRFKKADRTIPVV